MHFVHTAAANPDDIAINAGINPKLLDVPFSKDQDLAFQIAKLIQNWLEYATFFLSQQEINSIKTDPNLTDCSWLPAHRMLQIWHHKNASTDKCHYRVLVDTSCKLGYADVARSICELLGKKQYTSCAFECRYKKTYNTLV